MQNNPNEIDELVQEILASNLGNSGGTITGEQSNIDSLLADIYSPSTSAPKNDTQSLQGDGSVAPKAAREVAREAALRAAQDDGSVAPKAAREVAREAALRAAQDDDSVTPKAAREVAREAALRAAQDDGSVTPKAAREVAREAALRAAQDDDSVTPKAAREVAREAALRAAQDDGSVAPKAAREVARTVEPAKLARSFREILSKDASTDDWGENEDDYINEEPIISAKKASASSDFAPKHDISAEHSNKKIDTTSDEAADFFNSFARSAITQDNNYNPKTAKSNLLQSSFEFDKISASTPPPSSTQPALPFDDEKDPTVEFPTLELPYGKMARARKLRQKASSFVISPDTQEESPSKYSSKPESPILANQVDDKFREFFGETVAVDRAEIERGIKGKKAGKLLHDIFGKRMEETGSLNTIEQDIVPDDDLPETEVESEYFSPSSAQNVADALKNMRANASLRVTAAALTSGLLLYLGFSARTGLLPAIPTFDPSVNPFFFLLANFVLLSITCVVALTTFLNGISGLFGETTADSLPATAATCALVQNLYFMIFPDTFSPEKFTLFAPVAAILLLANLIGKRLRCASVRENFDLVSVGHEHYAAHTVQNRDVASRVCNGIGEKNPVLLLSRPTALVKGFVKQSFSTSKSETSARILSYAMLISAIVGGLVLYVQTKSLASAFTAFAALACFSAPLTSALLYTLPCSLMHRSSTKVGAVTAGWSAIEALGDVNTVTVSARDLFPPSTVRLHGVKTFEKERIDLAILYAASILIDGCDTLRDIFLGVIENKTEMLYKVENLTVDAGFGFTAWIEHSHVIIGNRDMMQKKDIVIPSLDFETKYTKGERSPIYLAVSGKLFGMFVVSYSADNDTFEVVQDLRRSGINLLVKSDDFSISSSLVSTVYSLPSQSVKVLTTADREMLAQNIAYLPESDGIMTHIGTFSSFIGGLRAAQGALSGVKMGGIVQTCAITLGIVISLLLCFTGGIASISLAAILLYQAAWGALTILMPIIKKY